MKLSTTFYVLICLILSLVRITNGANCLESERLAILTFKVELVDDYGRLSSWGTEEDCCKWKGVKCDNQTNHIVKLDIRGPINPDYDRPYAPLRGKITALSLSKLVDLKYLDISGNDFNGTQIPESIISLRKLKHLNLSFSNFSGLIPKHVSNLTMLRSIDFGGNLRLESDGLEWLSGLELLEYMDLTRVRLYNAATWFEAISKLERLKELHLSFCELFETFRSSIHLLNTSSSLSILDLSYNDFQQDLFEVLLNQTSLSSLDVSGNQIEGEIPNALGNLKSLTSLDLFGNQLEGQIPSFFTNLRSLRFLSLSLNKLNGHISHTMNSLRNCTMLERLHLGSNALHGSLTHLPKLPFLKVLLLRNNRLNGSLEEGELRFPSLEVLQVYRNQLTGRVPNLTSFSMLTSLGLSDNMLSGSLTEDILHLPQLQSLYLDSNQLEGIITEEYLRNMPHLRRLDLSFNSNLTLKVSSNWNPPFQLDSLRLTNCNLGPHFPNWLQTQKQLQELDISNGKISDSVPAWFWRNQEMVQFLNMSHNEIWDVVPISLLNLRNLELIDLTSNLFSGALPALPPYIRGIFLSRNKFSGTITSFCNGKQVLRLLDLSSNLLSEDIPNDCFISWTDLKYLNLANNNFSGRIPDSIGLQYDLSSLHLRNNRFGGEIPLPLRNCSRLKVLDLGENQLTGYMPAWIGETMPNLGVLSMSFNKFHGTLPSSLCHLTKIQVLDFSMNNLSGIVPKCVNNFTLMSSKPHFNIWDPSFEISWYLTSINDSVKVMWKRGHVEYSDSLALLKIIDLSSNNLVGEIPTEITSLIGLVGLNLSRNNFIGVIPSAFGELESLSFLDLSHNQLTGGIPSTISQLNFLGILDLSVNNLSGRIPWINHLQTFDAFVYMGNPGLCGAPLVSKPCPEDVMNKVPNFEGEDMEYDDNGYISKGFYISLALGFIIATWGTVWTCFMNKSCITALEKVSGCAGNWFHM